MLNGLLEARGLMAKAHSLRAIPLQELVREPGRSTGLLLHAGDLEIDLTRHRVDTEALEGLLGIADHLGFEQRREALFRGDNVNRTESRAALHTALRAPPSAMPSAVMASIVACREAMASLSHQIIDGTLRGASGEPFTDIVNIGIGGSDLGPRMAVTALRSRRTRLRVHFVSNVDPDDMGSVLSHCQPATTLFVVSSKTFTTQETLLNAGIAKRWIVDCLGDEAVQAHFTAVSTATGRAVAFGIKPDRILPMWDWVGGRYSVWSAIGFPLMLSIGPAAFTEFLSGAWQIDEHFRTAPAALNAPLVLGALSVWYRNVFGAQTHGVIAYEQRLELFVDHLQQLDMESLGKRVREDGSPVDSDTGAVIWGGVGTNTQHSFHQWLHQGTSLCPVDFLVGLSSDRDIDGQHACLLANCLAQSSALLEGCSPADVEGRLDTHRHIPGGRPHSLIVYPSLTPSVLGQLIALYEHRVFAQSVFWRINPFDQFGVELGKTISKSVLEALTLSEADWLLGEERLMANLDPALCDLIRRYRTRKA